MVELRAFYLNTAGPAAASAAAAAAASAHAYPPNPQYSPAAVQAAPHVAGAYSPHIAQLIDKPGQITPLKRNF